MAILELGNIGAGGGVGSAMLEIKSLTCKYSNSTFSSAAEAGDAGAARLGELLTFEGA